jgi:hypothetical protein
MSITVLRRFADKNREVTDKAAARPVLGIKKTPKNKNLRSSIKSALSAC